MHLPPDWKRALERKMIGSPIDLAIRRLYGTQAALNVTTTALLLASLAKVAVSSGSACTSASVEPSYVLKAIGRSDQLAHAGLRLSVGRYTTEEEIDFAITEISRVVSLLRKQ